MKPLIVTVEDDSIISELIEFNLKSEGYDVKSYHSGITMLDEVCGLGDVALFILDIMLPDMDGFEICRQIRQNPEMDITPIIMLTARNNEKDKINALDSGADDYITKPFGVREFLARVNTNIRRYMKLTGSSPKTEITAEEISTGPKKERIITYADIKLDDERHRVFKGQNEIEMTNREYELLKFLMINKGIAFNRDELLGHVWGYEYAGETRTVDVHIRQLRRKLEKDDAKPEIIQTIRGRGYRFSED
ncbi:MAG: winged helix-turn-helix domain-containing protein [Saccharofermentanales bacterium]